MIAAVLAILAGVATVATWASLHHRRRARAFETAWREAVGPDAEAWLGWEQDPDG